jgi:polysaccharide biosynthesis protein PslJ
MAANTDGMVLGSTVPHDPVPHEPRARPRPPRDAVTVLTVLLVTLLILPSRYVFGTLGAAGTPAQIFGLGVGLWWCMHWFGRAWPDSRVRQPVRVAVVVLFAAIFVSYLQAALRPIQSAELSAADLGLLSMLSWLAMLLVAMDGIPSRERFDVLLRRLAMLGGLIAVLGILQFFTGATYTEYLRLPGLTENGVLISVGEREGFLRPAGTARHPIEFAVVLTMILPIALHYAAVDRHRATLARWWPVVALAVALPISVSRSAIVGLVVSFAVLLPTWPRAWRLVTYVVGGLLLLSMFVVLPGFLGALLGLFTGISQDSSALSRTDSYAFAWSYVMRAPLFGRGIGTFLPKYRILDNAYLGALIETGAFGLTAMLALFAVGAVTAFRLRRAAAAVGTVSVGPAIAGSIAAGAATFALFDALSFPMAAGLLFLLVGVGAAARRLSARPQDLPAEPFLTEGSPRHDRRRWRTRREGRA